MPDLAGGSTVLTVWCVGVGGSIAALSCLLLERSPRRRYGKVMAASAALIFLVGACACAAGHAAQVWMPIGALGLVCVLAWATHYPKFLRVTRRLARPRTIWILLLIASPIYATYCTCDLNGPGFEGKSLDSFVASRNEVPDLRLRTDRGRDLRLYRFVLSKTAQQAEQEWIADGHLECHVIRTADLDPDCNCHGWVFAGGRYALRSEDVDEILADGGYQVVDDPKDGDLIVYHDSSGAIVHTGLVQHVVSKDLVLIESKWGPLGRYLHPADYQPYGLHFGYYRSKRAGHQLAVVNVARSVSCVSPVKPPSASTAGPGRTPSKPG